MTDATTNLFLILFTIAAAPCMASFGMLMGDRWIEDRPSLDYLRSISIEPSRCDLCLNKISGLSLLPIVGWLFARGRCACGKTKIPPVLFLAECAALAFGVALTATNGPQAIYFLPAIAGACAAARSDWRIHEVHESASLLIAISGLLIAFNDGLWADHLVAMAAIATPFVVILPLYAWLGRIPLIPQGDIYLATALSLTLTPNMLAVFIAALIPAGFLVRFLVQRQSAAERASHMPPMQNALPMAPMLTAAWAIAIILPFRI